MQKLVLIGGGHAFWEISELIEDINKIKETYEIIGILDDNPAIQGLSYNNLIVDGPIEKVKNYPADVKFIFAIGSFKTRLIRASILDRIAINEERFETLIHPSAKVFSTSRIGHGCIVHYGTVIFNHTIIESFSILAANCVIAVNNYIGKGALFGSNVTTTTGVKIGSFSFIGSSSSIGENVEVEPGAQVGMGSLVLKNIKAGHFVLGNPLRVLDKIEVNEEIISTWHSKKNQSILNK